MKDRSNFGTRVTQLFKSGTDESIGDKLDFRAMGLGILLGAVLVGATIQFGFDGADIYDIMSITLAGILLAGVPTGILVGWRSRSRHVFREGGLATTAAVGLGVLGWSVLSAVLATSFPLAHRLDIVFVTVGFDFFIWGVCFPGYFLVGGYVAQKASRFGTDSEWKSVEESIDYGKFE